MGARTKTKEPQAFDELRFSDEMDKAMKTARSLVRTVAAVLISDDEHSHLFVTLDLADDALRSAK
jgi:hypothetical protein